MIDKYKADPNHSSAHFNLKNLVIPDVEGDFARLAGTFSYNPERIEESLIEALIDVKTVTTGDEDRDLLLKGETFFDVLNYPTIKFKSKNFSEFDQDILSVTGDLTIKNITNEVILNVERPEHEDVINIVASTLVNREKFELVLSSVLEVGEMLIGDNIQITMSIQLTKV